MRTVAAKNLKSGCSLEILDNIVNINRAWEHIRKKHKIPTSHLKRVLVSANGSNMKCGLVNKVRNL